MKLYVGNLSYDVTDDKLRDIFKAFGDVESAKVIEDRDSGRSKGFGFVEMPKQDQAVAAMKALNGTEQNGRAITVNEARPQEPRGDRGGGDRGRGRFGGGGGGRNRY